MNVHTQASMSAPGLTPSAGLTATILQATRLPVTLSDPHLPDNPLVFANAAFCQLTGYTQEEVQGKNCRFLQGPDTDREAVAAIRKAIETCQPIHTELLNYRKDGSTFWNDLFICPIYDEQGRLQYFFGSQLDVTRRHKAEDVVHQMLRMEAIGLLTGHVAHDFNNLLTVILGYLDLARMRATDDPPLRSQLDAIEHAAVQGQKLSQKLLAFARQQPLEPQWAQLNEQLPQWFPMLMQTLGGGIRLETREVPGLWPCWVDVTQLEMALLNLAFNARDAMPDGGTVRLWAQNIRVPEGTPPPAGGLKPGAYVQVGFSDNGLGMTPEVLARATEPFFTTKPVGHGTGLGLSQVEGFLKQSGGALQLSSTLGEGTELLLYLPARALDEAEGAEAKAPSASKVSPALTQPKPRHQTVLVVEDNPPLRALAIEILSIAGYQVDTAPNAVQALKRLSEMSTPVDLLFSDMVMPGGLTGLDLALLAVERHPQLAVLLTTGFASELVGERMAQQPFPVIRKPYRAQDLIQQVETLLATKKSRSLGSDTYTID